MTEIIQDSSIATFLNEAGSMLYQQEAANSLILGICEDHLAQGRTAPLDSLFIRIVEDGKTKAAALQINAFYLALSQSTAAQLDHLAEHLQAEHQRLPGVAAPEEEAELFAQRWSSLSGQKAHLGMDQQIYFVTKVILPKGVEGDIQPADPTHRSVLAQWMVDSAREMLPAHEHINIEQGRRLFDQGLAKHSLYVWMSHGNPVAMASTSRSTRNGISVNRVYTPHEHRSQGYGSALVARLSQRLLDSGKSFCALYADLKNPHANKIYQNVGYQPLIRTKLILFE